MRREFVLQKQEQDKYYITEIDALKSIIKSCECSPTYTLVEGEQEDVTVICDPNFMHELLAYYHWGENHPNNYYEDVFRIAGQVLYNQETKSTILIARFLVKVVASERSKTAVVTSSQGKIDCIRQAFLINECLDKSDYDFMKGFGQLTIIGAGHSHPNLKGIDVNMSGIDVEDHQKALDYETMPWLTQIVDPNRGLSAFYYGKEMKKPKVVYLFYPGDDLLFELKTSFLHKRKTTNIIPLHKKYVYDDNSIQATSETSNDVNFSATNSAKERNNWFKEILTHLFNFD